MSNRIHRSAPVTVVAATTLAENEFWEASLLARSISRIPEEIRPLLQVTFSNTGPARRGLSAVYNDAITTAGAEDLLVFVHDDVYLNDWFVSQRVREGLARFDILGVVGAVNPDPQFPSWALAFDDELAPIGWQDGLIRSGAISRFDYAHPEVFVYGDLPLEVALLDGLLLAASAQTLRQHSVQFDDQFEFHMYDIDFCRTAVRAGLRVGTWPIALTHNSAGNFDSAGFRSAARIYLAKWLPGSQQIPSPT